MLLCALVVGVFALIILGVTLTIAWLIISILAAIL